VIAERPHSVPLPSCPVAGRLRSDSPLRPARRGGEPGSAEAITGPLLEYLSGRFGLRHLTYAQPPVAVPDGWEAWTYSFRLAGRGLPRPWAEPLLLRVHSRGESIERVRREYAVPRYLAERDYSVPRPLLLEESAEPLGGPFLVMEWISGPTLLKAMLCRPWLFLPFPARMAAVQARLHALPADGFPAPPGPFVERQLEALRKGLADHALRGLEPGLRWLERDRPPEPETPSILHLDFHPLNLIERADRSLAVLDWTYADLGDAHADVATTLMLLKCAPAGGQNVWERLAVLPGRPITRWWYLHAYRRQRPLDRGRLAWYRAWAALRQLVRYGRCLGGDREASPLLAAHLDPDLLAALCRYFRRWSGVEVSL
jgi:aminoglycoside phosphotransferase (APT) family kinase protein